jgi:hypothetical protein
MRAATFHPFSEAYFSNTVKTEPVSRLTRSLWIDHIVLHSSGSLIIINYMIGILREGPYFYTHTGVII